MILIEKIKEAEMVAEFLKAEIQSQRFSKKILTVLKQSGKGSALIEKPNLESAKENEVRKNLLFENYREEMFEHFPTDVAWYEAELSKADLIKVKYTNYSYWNELSGGTSLVIDGAKAVRGGREAYGVKNDNFIKAFNVFKKGKKFPKIILVANNENSDLILLEGHVRLTVMLMDEKYIPKKLSVFIGYSEGVEKWNNS